MPELPEVESVAQELRTRLGGCVIAGIRESPLMAIEGAGSAPGNGLVGATVGSISRKGKTLVIGLNQGQEKAETGYLLWHLGMSGQLFVAAVDTPIAVHTHVRLMLDDGCRELRYRDPRRFGRIRWVLPEKLEAELARMGPDVRSMPAESFLKALKGRRGAIKSLLMNQRILSGLGNIYTDESLFAARIHPTTPAGWIPPPKALSLYRAVQRVLREAIKKGGTTFRDHINSQGRPGSFQGRLRVYGRRGKGCRRCGEKIRRVIVGGRSSHFCPACQPAPSQRIPGEAASKNP